MKSTLKKALSAVLVLTLTVMMMSGLAVTASAANIFAHAKTLKPLNKYELYAPGDTSTYYKIVISKPGRLRFSADSVDYAFGHDLMDSHADVVQGHGYDFADEYYDIEKKGTYYLHTWGGFGIDRVTTGFYYTFTPSEEPSVSIAVNANIGEEVDLTGVTENYKGKIKWSSSKSSVASVDDGIVSANKAGTAVITAEMENGDYAEIIVKVNKTKVPSIILNVNVSVGDELDFSAAASNYKGDITWNSTDKKVASVKNGKVQALKKGTAKIRAYTDDGIYAEISVKVK